MIHYGVWQVFITKGEITIDCKIIIASPSPDDFAFQIKFIDKDKKEREVIKTREIVEALKELESVILHCSFTRTD